jgi:hypothetical protein
LHREKLAEIEKQLVESPSPETLQAIRYQERLAQERIHAGELLKEIQSVTI